jgi:hypothetical protein
LSVSGTSLGANNGTGAKISIGTSTGTDPTVGKGVHVALGTAGTAYYANAATGYTGNLIDLRVNAVSAFSVNQAGLVTANALTVNGVSTLNGNVTISGANTLTTGTGLTTIGGPITVTSASLQGGALVTTTGVEITGLNKPLTAGTYAFQYYIRYQAAATTTGVKFGVNFTGTQTAFMANAQYQTSGSAASDGTHDQATTGAAEGIVFGYSTRSESTTAPNLGPTEAVDTANADMLAYIQGLIVVTAAGDLELWHGSEVAASSTVKAGTSLVLTKTSP